MRKNDLKNILNTVNIPVNLEIAANSEMIEIATQYNPKFVCFVPENRKEITTEGGLDVAKNFKALSKVLKPILDTEINISVPKNAAVRIKVKQDCRDYIKTGRTERVEIDGKSFNVIGDESVKHNFGYTLYVYYLELTK